MVYPYKMCPYIFRIEKREELIVLDSPLFLCEDYIRTLMQVCEDFGKDDKNKGPT